MSDFYQTGVVTTLHRLGKVNLEKIEAETIMEDPLGVPLIASWDRVTSAIPDILSRIKEAVEEDNK